MALRGRRRPTVATSIDPDPADGPAHWRDLFDPDEQLPDAGLPPWWCSCPPDSGQTQEQHDDMHAWEWRIASARRRFAALTDPDQTPNEDR